MLRALMDAVGADPRGSQGAPDAATLQGCLASARRALLIRQRVTGDYNVEYAQGLLHLAFIYRQFPEDQYLEEISKIQEYVFVLCKSFREEKLKLKK